MKSSIRVAGRPGDARAIARVHVDSWVATYGDGLLPRRYLDRLTVPGLTHSWRRRLARQQRGEIGVRVAECDGAVIGFAEYGPCYSDSSLLAFAGEVHMLYVHPDYLGHGVGRALLQGAMEDLSDRGHHWLVIWVVSGNWSARSFYQRMGLRHDGSRRTDYFAGEQVPVVRYAKPLNPVIDFDRLL